MPRPDEHPQLKAMGIGEATCDTCLYDLFPQAPDDICNDCSLNPMQDEVTTARFIRDTLKRESSFSADELNIRQALRSLRQQ